MFQNFSKITTLNLSHAVPVKTKVEISQIFEAFFKYMNFITSNCPKFIRAFSQLFFDLSRNPLCFFTEKRVVQTAGDVVYDRSSISSQRECTVTKFSQLWTGFSQSLLTNFNLLYICNQIVQKMSEYFCPFLILPSLKSKF